VNDLGPPTIAAALFDAACSGDVEGATDLVAARLEHDDPAELLRVLAEVQLVVGQRWAANELTIAGEHRASAVVDAALALVERTAEVPGGGAGRVAVVCAETEWHTLPARFAAAWLRLGGWSVDFLGGSLPATVLVEDLHRRPPDVVAVSCSVPDQLFGARRTIAAAHRAGLPVVAGGAAFGTDERRAVALGSSAWAVGGADIAPAAERAHAVGPAPDVDPLLELRALEVVAHQDRLVRVAVDQLRERFPRFLEVGSPAEAQTIADVRSIVRFAAASILVDDPSLFDGFLDWLVGILVVRGVPVASLLAAVEALLAAEPPDPARPILAGGRDRIPRAG